MTNHLHLLVQVGDAPLGHLMLRIASRYARTAQARLHTTGHLFERRYHAILIDADQYLLELLRHIHLNPVRARMANHPSDYPWSSHRAFLGTLPCQQFSVTEEALRSKSSHRLLTKARAWIAHQAVITRVASLSEVARTFARNEANLRESVKRHVDHR